jgi:hypothetical protein
MQRKNQAKSIWQLESYMLLEEVTDAENVSTIRTEKIDNGSTTNQ